jgi:hypothetical protein
MPSPPDRIPVPLSNRIRYLLTQQLQGWLFVLSVVLVLVLWFGEKPRLILTGQVEMLQVVVPASRDGVLQATPQPLSRFDRVQQGVTQVASIDVTDALLEMQSLTAHREQLLAELEAQRQRIRRDQLQWQWQCEQERREMEQQTIDRLRVALALQGRVDQLTSDMIDLDQKRRSLAIRSRENAATLRQSELAVASLMEERNRIERLIELRMSPASQLVETQQSLTLQQETLRSARELDRLMVTQAEEIGQQLKHAKRRLADATARFADLGQSAGEWQSNRGQEDPSGIGRRRVTEAVEEPEPLDGVAMLEPFVRAIAVEDAKIRVLAHQIASNQIVAPATGTITEVHHPPGTFVRSGDPILTIASDQQRWIVAFLNADDQDLVSSDAEVQIRVHGPEMFVATSSISEFGNTFEPVPKQLRDNVNVSQWGVPIKIPVPPGIRVTPGQMVELVVQ